MRYKHDCNYCIALGMCENFDLYICNIEVEENLRKTTLIARYSDFESDYISGLHGITDLALIEARRLALDMGYLSTVDNFSYTFNNLLNPFETKNLFSTPPYTPTPISEEDCIISSETVAAIEEMNLVTADWDTSSLTTAADWDVSIPTATSEVWVPTACDVSTPDFPHMYCRHINMYLTQYIKSESGKRCGLIQTFKENVDDFNDNYCINSDYHISKPIVLITHSKVNPNSEDVFNVDKAYHICDSRSEYMLRVLGGQLKPRVKSIMKMPSTKIINYYKDMYDRARRYYKDCDMITKYYDMFEYKNTREKIQKNIDHVKDIFDLGIIPANLFTSTKIKCNVNT